MDDRKPKKDSFWGLKGFGIGHKILLTYIVLGQ